LVTRISTDDGLRSSIDFAKYIWRVIFKNSTWTFHKDKFVDNQSVNHQEEKERKKNAEEMKSGRYTPPNQIRNTLEKGKQ